jgi:hypothetical protein
MCDFWARVKLGKLQVEELVQDLRSSISSCEGDLGSTLDDAFSQYWSDFGIKNIGRFRNENPDLFSKMRHAEEQTRMILLKQK